ncbi:MAG TPA: cofactor-independent phosphoglycerate mutase [Dehalococcoidia bacterium]|nr:cofactor-independent phosphoglycerate mutase [Dehalococcoidia bacterium]
MKYVVLIMDGAAGYPIPERGGRTSLELAKTPNLDALAKGGTVGLARTVPPGMEASSACACMSVLGYDPKAYYKGRAGIEARSMGIPIGDGEVVFRCNLVAVREGKMWSYSSGYISTEEAHTLVGALNEKLGDDEVQFFPGVSYRHICKIRGHEDTLQAECTSPHDIPDKEIAGFLPRGQGSKVLLDLMERSQSVLANHPLNRERIARGAIPATMIWLFWGSSRLPDMPSFEGRYGLKAAMTSGVDLLKGLAQLAGMAVLEIHGVTDNLDNDYAAQANGTIKALAVHDLVVVHIEAPDEAAHDRAIEAKIEAIKKIDGEVVSRLRAYPGDIRLLIMPDHPTPIVVQTHTDDPVPFLTWGTGVKPSGAVRFTEAEAKGTGLFLEEGYKIMDKFVAKAGI